ncbi:class I SAM-dependent methyltransferase [Paenibacillus sp. WLX2291]|uniref:class I SAM-dependent methyltransferase n=1 Tax=Paenibacillus sp. WLX2291 TaxID=3296934 RepID=UPI0039841301
MSAQNKQDATQRFSARVDDYAKYRPSYPAELLDYMQQTIGLQSGHKVADVGAGTGIFTALLLERGLNVFAVEPNEPMRRAAGETLPAEHLHLVDGSAEQTNLPDHSVDVIVCAQSFHWFDTQRAVSEFRRIAGADGKLVLIWNTRLQTGSEFLERYEQLLQQFGTDYNEVNHQYMFSQLQHPVFREGTMQRATFINRQVLDLDGVQGRLRSTSYVPSVGEPGYAQMMEEAERIFNETEQDGVVYMDYETEVYWGQL